MVKPSSYSPRRPRAVRAAIQPGRTKLVLVESPTNPRMQICDIAAIAAMSRAAGAVTCVDNSIMAPVFQVATGVCVRVLLRGGREFVSSSPS